MNAAPSIRCIRLALSILDPSAGDDLVRSVAQDIQRLLNTRRASQVFKGELQRSQRRPVIAVRFEEGEGEQAANVTSLGRFCVGDRFAQVILEHFELLHDPAPVEKGPIV